MIVIFIIITLRPKVKCIIERSFIFVDVTVTTWSDIEWG